MWVATQDVPRSAAHPFYTLWLPRTSYVLRGLRLRYSPIAGDGVIHRRFAAPLASICCPVTPRSRRFRTHGIALPTRTAEETVTDLGAHLSRITSASSNSVHTSCRRVCPTKTSSTRLPAGAQLRWSGCLRRGHTQSIGVPRSDPPVLAYSVPRIIAAIVQAYNAAPAAPPPRTAADTQRGRFVRTGQTATGGE